ncbi:MAG: response regulator transcription factor [Clostridia bacterium]|nr:response regulator transcription factor [Clostridia bacterium]
MEIKVMIVDDQRLMREGLRTILDLEKDLKVVCLAENGQDALDKIDKSRPDVVLMDIRMPVMNGVECTGIIKKRYPNIKVLILTTFDDDEYIIDGLKNGAEGYLLKDLPSEKLIGSIRDIYNGSSIMQSEIAAKVISHITGQKVVHHEPVHETNEYEGVDQLTEREKEVLKLVAKGMSNKEIANTIFISEGTVKNYISNIYDKIGINERSKLVLYAIENKFI